MNRWPGVIAILAVALSVGALARDTRDPDLHSRVERLETQIQQLIDERNDATERSMRPAVEDSFDAPPAAPDPSLENRIRQLESALAQGLVAGRPALIPPGAPVEELELERTRTALESIQEEQLQDQLERWVAREQEGAERVVDHLLEKFPLAYRDEAQLREIFLSEQTAQSELITSLWSDEAPTDRAGLTAAWDRAVASMKEARTVRDQALENLFGAERWGKVQEEIRAAKAPKRPSSP